MEIKPNDRIKVMWLLRNEQKADEVNHILTSTGDRVKCLNFGEEQIWLLPAGISAPPNKQEMKEKYYSFYSDNFDQLGVLDQRCKVLEPQELPHIDELKSVCSTEDLEAGMIEKDDPLICGTYISGRLVALASMLDYEPGIGDIGILVHPEYRRLGLSFETCKKLGQEMAKQGKLIHYGCSELNMGSFKTALKLEMQLGAIVEYY